MASTYPRKGSDSLQISVKIGESRKAKSLHTQDLSLATAVADRFTALEKALAPEVKARQATLLGLVEEMFIAAQVPIPWETEASKVKLSQAFAAYLDYRKPKITPEAFNLLSNTLGNFIQVIGDKPIEEITPMLAQRWYDELLKGVAAGTANNRLTCLRAAFEFAVAMRWIGSSPAASISTETSDEVSRLPFSDSDFTKLTTYLKEHDQKDWLTAVMVARYSGLRMGDIMGLDSSNFYIMNDHLAFMIAQTSKAGKDVTIPLLGGLNAYIRGFDFKEGERICGALAGRSIPSLSASFVNLLTKAGIDTQERILETNGRTQRLIGFHSLRHAFATWLAESGVPEDLRCLLAGHEAKSHRGYVHQSAAALAERLMEFGVK